MTGFISIFASDILPIFLIAALGFILARRLEANVKTLAHVVFYTLSPCLVFKILVTSGMTGPEVGRMALFAVLIMGLMGVIARLVAIPFRLKRAELSAFLLVAMLSNSGNYGLPVVLFAFGAPALSHATVFFVITSMLTYTVGVFLAAAGRQTIPQAIRGVARVPTIYAVAAAALVIANGTTVPDGIMRPVGMLGDATIPIMILVLGMQLERAKFAERPGVVAAAVCLSLIVAPLLALGLAPMIGLAGPARQAGVLLASMPAAVVTTILALQFDIAPAFVTSTVFASTLLSPLTLTALIAYLR
jgi:predicted permease